MDSTDTGHGVSTVPGSLCLEASMDGQVREARQAGPPGLAVSLSPSVPHALGKLLATAFQWLLPFHFLYLPFDAQLPGCFLQGWLPD